MALLQSPGDFTDSALDDGSTNIHINTTAKTIKLVPGQGGLISADGALEKAIYSFIKEEWKDDPLTKNLAAFDFPFQPITDEFYELINGWDWADATTRESIRRGGWLVRNTGGNVTQHWAAFALLNAEVDDQIYYEQDDGTVADFTFAGPTAEAVQVIDDPNGDGNYADGYNRSTDITVRNREQAQLYSSASTSAAGESSLLAPKLFSLGVPTGTDLNIAATDALIALDDTVTFTNATNLINLTSHPLSNGNKVRFQGGVAPTGLSLDTTYYVINANANDFQVSTTEGGAAATFSDDGTPTTNVVSWPFNGMTITRYASAQIREIGTGNNYNFGWIIDGAGGQSQEIYEYVQWALRQTTNQDAGAGTLNGNVMPQLLEFVGSDLKTLNATNTEGGGTGVFIDNFSVGDTNSLFFRDNTEAQRNFPYVATGQLLFNPFLVNDASAVYRVYFTDGVTGGQEFGNTTADIVQDNSNVDIAGPVSGQSAIDFDFDFDNSTQAGRTAGQPVNVTAIAIGLDTGQYVKTTATITRSTGNVINFVAAQERNYAA